MLLKVEPSSIHDRIFPSLLPLQREDKVERQTELKMERERLGSEVERLRGEKEAAEEPERLAKEEHEKVCVGGREGERVCGWCLTWVCVCVCVDVGGGAGS